MKKPLSATAFFAFILFISCQSASSGNSVLNISSEKTAEEIRMELKQKEQQEFNKYIDAKASMRKNFFGETVLEGTITNNATIASFKDIVFEFDFISKTGTVIESQNQTVYEILEPGQSKPFKIKTSANKAAASFNFRLANASPNN